MTAKENRLRQQQLAEEDHRRLRTFAREQQARAEKAEAEVKQREATIHNKDMVLAAYRAEVEQLRDALTSILQWAEAYPADIFTDQDLPRADAVLAAAGISMTAMHGQWARRIMAGIGDIARNALPPAQETPNP